MRKHLKLVLALLAFVASASIFGREAFRFVSTDDSRTREYKRLLLSALKVNDANLEELIPNATVCFVPEGRYAPYYVKELLKSEVIHSEGDESAGHWFALVKDDAQNKTWIFMLSKDEYDWNGEGYVCPKRTKSTLANGKATISPQ